jgi:hypothetical protein
MRQITFVTQTEDGYLIRRKVGKKRWTTILVEPEKETTEKDVIALAIALANSVE